MWQPSQERIERSNMRRFISANASRIEHEDYASLYAWSIAEPAEFWSSIWRLCGILGDLADTPIVTDIEKMPGARWFPNAKLNFAENLLMRGPDDGAAIIFTNECGQRRELTWRDLRQRVAGLAAALLDLGVGPGDRVAGWLPNLPETTIAMLATTSIGAIWSSCSPDFGISGVLDRFGQIGPRVLLGADGYHYNGKHIDCLPGLADIARNLDGLVATIVVAYTRERPELSGIANALAFNDLATTGKEPRFEAFPFAQPAYILYTSGTTGRPKSIVHGAGGTLIQHLKEHALHTDIGIGDRVFYFTTCGWMMWHWLMSSLASGATIVLYDGMPLYPDPGVLWRMAEAESVNVFGTSAKYLSALEKSGYRPAERTGLAALEAVLSTGSPLAGSSFDFAYAHIKQDLQLSSIAGGTDLISCFALGNPMLPVYRSELQCRGLGMKVEIYDDDGHALRGRKGELVCTAPFPSMPLGFWSDPDDKRYRAAYFEHFPNVWRHGDYAELTEHDGIILYGRSDTVLNPGGVRIGTAEIYRIVDNIPEVLESIVIGQDWDGDTRIVLFVRMQPGHALDEHMRERIRAALRRDASPRHVPAKILEVTDIPRTMSGKIVEIAVRDAVHGREVANIDALANPSALEEFRDRSELRE